MRPGAVHVLHVKRSGDDRQCPGDVSALVAESRWVAVVSARARSYGAVPHPVGANGRAL